MPPHPKSVRTFFALAAAALAMTHFCIAAPSKRVVVKSKASANFIEIRKQSDFAALSYVFAQGERFSDSSRGDAVSNVDFQSIAETLAIDLGEQNFIPTKEPENADILLVIHWGGIERFEDPTKMLALERAYEGVQQSVDNVGSDYVAYDAWETRFDLVQHESDLIHERMNDAKMARLLGFDEDIARERKKPFSTTLEETLLVQMQQERYLIIIMAWDNQVLRATGEKKLLWSTHMNMKALGTNFEDAIAFMSGAAVGYFGTESDGIKSQLYKQDEYQIEMGELEVIESGTSLKSSESSEASDRLAKSNARN
ncbi:hypothetical protein [Pelagicoccus sp. SDUM812002]|uniref:hypothetical protein n=1 Tax=Pelagicoccus sp. SDUM812002 TaxID=3041266 RepID=UPI00280F0F3C|nr:hypothetical protein [Pelagicoccus sp. SDUM812002]MDQ8185688.1 hypothetical protein [Pelagicoccus sp. SDUM812002]